MNVSSDVDLAEDMIDCKRSSECSTFCLWRIFGFFLYFLLRELNTIKVMRHISPLRSFVRTISHMGIKSTNALVMICFSSDQTRLMLVEV